MDDPLHLAVARDHPLAEADEIRMADLADEIWIEGRDPVCAEPLQLAARAAGFEPKICFESAQWLGKQGLVAAGVGVTLIPTLALATVREDIVLRSLGPDAPRRHDLDRHAGLRLRGARGRADARGAAPGRRGALLLLRRLRGLTLESADGDEPTERSAGSRPGRSAMPRRRSGRRRSRR